jgi:hypothetical protein
MSKKNKNSSNVVRIGTGCQFSCHHVSMDRYPSTYMIVLYVFRFIRDDARLLGLAHLVVLESSFFVSTLTTTGL